MTTDKTASEMLAAQVAEKLRERAAKIAGYIASSQIVVDLLQPQLDAFDSRTGHDTYTVRIAVDHISSIRTQKKEAEELTAAADTIDALRTELQEAADSAAITGACIAKLTAEKAELEAVAEQYNGTMQDRNEYISKLEAVIARYMNVHGVLTNSDRALLRQALEGNQHGSN